MTSYELCENMNRAYNHRTPFSRRNVFGCLQDGFGRLREDKLINIYNYSDMVYFVDEFDSVFDVVESFLGGFLHLSDAMTEAGIPVDYIHAKEKDKCMLNLMALFNNYGDFYKVFTGEYPRDGVIFPSAVKYLDNLIDSPIGFGDIWNEFFFSQQAFHKFNFANCFHHMACMQKLRECVIASNSVKKCVEFDAILESALLTVKQGCQVNDEMEFSESCQECRVNQQQVFDYYTMLVARKAQGKKMPIFINRHDRSCTVGLLMAKLCANVSPQAFGLFTVNHSHNHSLSAEAVGQMNDFVSHLHGLGEHIDDIMKDNTVKYDHNIFLGGDPLFLKNLLEKMKDPLTKTFCSILVLVIFILLVKKYPDNDILRVLLVIISGYVLIYVAIPNITRLVSKLIVPSGDFVDIARKQSITHDDVVDIISEGVSMFTFCGHIKVSDASSFGKSMAEMNNYQGHFTEYLQKVVKWLEKTVMTVASAAGERLSIFTSVYEKQITVLSKGMFELHTLMQESNNRITADVARKSKELSVAIELFSSQLSNGKEDMIARNAVRQLLMDIRAIMLMVQDSPFSRGKRQRPTCFCVVGESQIGKTYCQELLLALVGSKIFTDQEKLNYQHCPQSCIYEVRPGQKYFDDFADPPITIVSDTFAGTDKRGDEASEPLFIVNAIGDQSYPLPAANLLKKNTIFFNSRFMYLVTNKDYMNQSDKTLFQSLNYPLALINRVNEHCYRQMVKKPYWSNEVRTDYPYPTGLNGCEFLWRKVDKEKAKLAKDPRDIYFWREWDIAKGNFKANSKEYNVEQFAEKIVEEYYKDFSISKIKDSVFAPLVSNCMSKKGEKMSIGDLLSSSVKRDIIDPKEKEAVVETSLVSRLTNYLWSKNGEKAFKQGLSSDKYVEVEGDLTDTFSQVKARIEAKPKMISFSDLIDLSDNSVGTINDYFEESLGHTLYRDPSSNYVESSVRIERVKDWLKEIKSDYSSPDEDIKTAIEGIPLDEVEHIVDMSKNDRELTENLSIWKLTGDYFSVAIARLQVNFRYFVDKMKFYWDNPVEWFSSHPIAFFLTCFTVGTMSGLMVYNFLSLIITNCLTLVGFKADEVKESNSKLEKIWDENPEEEELKIKQGRIKMDPDKLFVDARVDNLYYVQYLRRVEVDGVSKHMIQSLGNALALGGRFCCMNAHVWEEMCAIHDLNSTKKGWIAFTPFKVPDGAPLNTYYFDSVRASIDKRLAESHDLVTFEVVSGFHEHTVLERSMMSVHTPGLKAFIDSHQLSGALLVKSKASVNGQTFDYLKAKFEKIRRPVKYDVEVIFDDPISKTRVRTGSHIRCLADSFAINVPTVGGWCGSVGFITDKSLHQFTKYDESMQNPRLCYFHNSGSQDGNFGFGNCLYRETFAHIWEQLDLRKHRNIRPSVERLVRQTNVASSIFSRFGGKELAGEPLSVIPHFKTGPEEEVVITDGLLPAWQMRVGSTDKIMVSKNSTIKPTELNTGEDKEFMRSKLPTRQYPFYKDGVLFDPFKTGVDKFGQASNVVINEVNYNVVEDYVWSIISNNSDVSGLKRPLTDEEALTGQIFEPDFNSGLTGVDLDTSAGFILEHVKKRLGEVGKGKHWYLKRTEKGDIDFDFEYTKAFLEYTHVMEVELLNGDFTSNVIKLAGKDELLHWQDIKDGKLRIFFVHNAEDQHLFKKAFGGFAMWLDDNRIKNMYGLGLRTTKAEWTMFYHWLKTFSDKGNFKDWSKFDKRQAYRVIHTTKKFANNFYNDCYSDSDAYTIRNNLFDSLMNSLFILNDKEVAALFKMFSGNTSGNFLTAIINTTSNIMMCHVANSDVYLKHKQAISFNDASVKQVMEALRNVTENVRGVYYGDDMAVAVRSDLYHPRNLAKSIDEIFQMELTSSTKGDVGDFEPIEEGMFLGRNMKIIELNGVIICLGALKLESILSSIFWYKHYEDVEVLKVQVDVALGELARHGYSIYSTESDKIIKLCEEKLHWVPPVLDWYANLMKSLDTSYTKYSVARSCDEIDFVDAVKQSGAEERVYGGAVENEHVMTTSETLVQEKTTSFLEAEQIKITRPIGSPMTENSSTKYQSIKDVLGKQKVLTGVQFTTGSAAGTNLYTVDIESTLSSVAEWQDKLKGFMYFRGDFVFHVKINAYPFQSGKLLAHVLPNEKYIETIDPTYFKPFMTNLAAKIWHQHVELDMRETDSGLVVPYIAPTTHYSLKGLSSDVAAIGWGTIYLDVLAPLRTGTNGLTFAELQILGHWENVDLAGPIVTQGLVLSEFVEVEILHESKLFDVMRIIFPLEVVPQGKKKRKDFNSRELVEKPISSGLSIVADAVDMLGQIPILSDIAAPVSWAMRIGSGIASIFGWSKPDLNSEPTVVVNQFSRYMSVADGPNVAYPTGLIHDNCLKVSDNYSITNEDEMSWDFLKRVPFLWKQLTWTTGSASGTSLLSTDINPAQLFITGTSVHNAHTATWHQGPPIWYLSNHFSMWRGSFDVTMKFAKTQYHSGKLMITWSPYYNVSAPGTPTLANSLYAMRLIVDIREQNAVTFNLPYLINMPYLSMGSSDDFNQISYSGQLDILVFNDLRAPETCSGTIDLLFYIQGGEDLEYQAPKPAYGIYPMMFVPQASKDGEKEIVWDEEFVWAVKQSGKDYMDGGVLGNEDRKSSSTLWSELCNGEHFLSIKQLLNRVSFINLASNDPLGTGNTGMIYPYAISSMSIDQTTGALTHDKSVGDVFSIFAPMYMYFRGSVNVAILNGTGFAINAPNYYLLFCNANLTSLNWLLNVVTGTMANLMQTATGYGTTSLTSNVTPGVSSPLPITGNTTTPAIVKVPYQSRFPIGFTWRWRSDLNVQYKDVAFPSSALVIGASNNVFTTNTVGIGRSFHDSFTLSYFIGCPPVLASYT